MRRPPRRGRNSSPKRPASGEYTGDEPSDEPNCKKDLPVRVSQNIHLTTHDGKDSESGTDQDTAPEKSFGPTVIDCLDPYNGRK